jgi:hypothetical protein
LRQNALPEEAAAIESLAAASAENLSKAISCALKDLPPGNIAERVRALAALHVHFSRLAAKLGGANLDLFDLTEEDLN